MIAKAEKSEEESAKKGFPKDQPKFKGEKGYKETKGRGHTVARDEMAALMAKGQADDLLAWKVTDSGFQISDRTDFFLTPFEEAPLVGNNPFGGKRVTKGVTVNGLIGQLPKEKGKSLAEVNFQWKNPDFLFKNPDFLIKNPDFLLRSVDFIIQTGQGEAQGGSA